MSRLPHFKYQFASQVTPFADSVRLSGIGKLVARNRRRPDRAGREQLYHAFEMRAAIHTSRPPGLSTS